MRTLRALCVLAMCSSICSMGCAAPTTMIGVAGGMPFIAFIPASTMLHSANAQQVSEAVGVAGVAASSVADVAAPIDESPVLPGTEVNASDTPAEPDAVESALGALISVFTCLEGTTGTLGSVAIVAVAILSAALVCYQQWKRRKVS